jgi:hypothetical protein
MGVKLFLHELYPSPLTGDKQSTSKQGQEKKIKSKTIHSKMTHHIIILPTHTHSQLIPHLIILLALLPSAKFVSIKKHRISASQSTIPALSERNYTGPQSRLAFSIFSIGGITGSL